jgi:hypothetical protein
MMMMIRLKYASNFTFNNNKKNNINTPQIREEKKPKRNFFEIKFLDKMV